MPSIKQDGNGKTSATDFRKQIVTTAQNNSPDRMDDAIAWSIRLAEPDIGDEELLEFSAWLDADQKNRDAFERVSAFESSLDDAVADCAAAQAADHEITPSMVTPLPLHTKITSRRAWIAGGAALLAACAVLFVTVRKETLVEPTLYATDIGQQKNVALADGTMIELNTATTIIVAPDGVTRHVTLKRGEALFHVAKDSAHPFLVTVGARRVRVVGTVFSVQRNKKDITVVVAEGKVAVGPSTPASSDTTTDERHLVPGDKLVYANDTGATMIERVDPARALAWHRGYLVYENTPLAQVIADLNRYFPHPVSLEGAELQAQHFSGVLKIDSEAAVLRRLQQFLPLTVKKEADGRIILRSPPKHD